MIDFLFTLDQRSVEIDTENKTVSYSLLDYSPEEIIDRIDSYYRTGLLLDDKLELN